MSARVALGGAIVIAAASVAAVGCVSPIPNPGAAHVNAASTVYPGTTVEELREGRSLYVAKCAGCHQLYLPSHLAPARWPASVSEMRERAAISEAHEKMISKYLVAAALVGAAGD
ncbi:MAG: hypothetical protein IPM79_21160 [Polyangiaceae bacterium]|nr:hypothetical protein [Polyangiaceae bacterium]MBK8940057.1 hypothetical protein [Polyangiaceae bacterium]